MQIYHGLGCPAPEPEIRADANTSMVITDTMIQPQTSMPEQPAGLVLDHAKSLALEAGFSDAGLVALPHAADKRDARRFEQWVREGRAGSMHYLERAAENGQLVRASVSVPFAWAQSAIVCFARYDSAPPRSIAAAPPDAGWIARYAWSSRREANGARRPSDYHKVLLKRLKALEARLHDKFGVFESRAYVDTGPVVERSLATAAGLGWSAKNTCLIHPQLGSFGFLAVLLTSLEVSPRSRTLEVPDRCGSCRRCIDACPTDALRTPYQMDATRCIAYLTIEHKGPIAGELMEGMGRQVFGCDICQDVCPWNGKSLRSVPITVDPEIEPRPELVNPALEALAAMDEAAFEAAFNGSPVRRTGYNGLRRNIAIAMGNSGLGHFASRLEAWASESDGGLRAAASWALGKLRSAKSREGIS
jgi:epoxyqueuosine reductase